MGLGDALKSFFARRVPKPQAGSVSGLAGSSARPALGRDTAGARPEAPRLQEPWASHETGMPGDTYEERYYEAADRVWSAKSEHEKEAARAALKALYSEMSRAGVAIAAGVITTAGHRAARLDHRDGQIFCMFIAKLGMTEVSVRCRIPFPPDLTLPELRDVFTVDSTAGTSSLRVPSPAGPESRPIEANWKAAFDRKEWEGALTAIGPRAEEGDVDAQYHLGKMFWFGLGVPTDKAKAVAWYQRAADNDSVLAQELLGQSYERGEGVPKSFAEALKWYRRAAEKGHPNAQANLGFMYKSGDGVPFDHAEALMWFSLAAAGGDADAGVEPALLVHIRQSAATERKKISSWLTPGQVAEVDRRVKAWKPQ